MLSFSSSKELLKYTLALAGVGFAFAQTRLGKTDRIFGIEAEFLGMSFAQWLLALLLLVFFLSTLAAIAAFMGIIRQENEDEGHSASKRKTTLSANDSEEGVVTLTLETEPAEPADPEDTHEEDRRGRVNKVKKWSNRHLQLLLGGYLLATVFFVGEVLNPKKQKQMCQSIMLGLHVDYPCGASPKDIFEKGQVTP